MLYLQVCQPNNGQLLEVPRLGLRIWVCAIFVLFGIFLRAVNDTVERLLSQNEESQQNEM